MARDNRLHRLMKVGALGVLTQLGLNLVQADGDTGRAITRTREQWGRLLGGFGRAGGGAVLAALPQPALAAAASASVSAPQHIRRWNNDSPLDLAKLDARASGFAWDQFGGGTVYEINEPHRSAGVAYDVSTAVDLVRQWYGRNG